MPAAIGAAILAEIGATALAASTVATTVVGYAVISGALLAVQAVVEALSPAQKRNDAQITVRQAIPPRRRGHGREKLGGAIFFLDTQGGGIYRGVVHHAGRVSNIREYWLGDVKTGLTGQSGGVVPDAFYQGKVIIQAFNGANDQPAASGLLRFPYWTSAARLRGLTYTVVIAEPLKHGDKIFPEGAPDVRIVADLSPCYDPRNPGHNPADDSTWAWSDNASLALLDYLHDDSGFGIPFEEINLASFIALANVCDEPVTLRVPAADGATTEPRYRSWGTYTLDEERSTVLGRYLSACDAELTQDAEGRVAVTGGRWHPPTFTITEDMILGWDQFEEGSEAYATFNRVKWTFKSPLHDYQPLEGDSWDDADSQAAIGAIPTERDFGRAPSHSQGRRLAKIAAARGAPRFRFTGLRLAPAALPAYGEPVVRLIVPTFGIDATFAISKGALTGPMKCEPVFDLYSFGPEAYAWSPIEEGNPPPLPDASVPDPAPIPTGIVMEALRYTSAGVVTGLAARFTATAVAGRADLTLIGRYRLLGDTTWIDMAPQDGVVIAAPINDGPTYERQLAWLATGSISDWSPTATFSVTADNVAPAAPSYTAATRSGGSVNHAFRQSGSANARSIRLSRAAGAGKALADAAQVFAEALGPNQGDTYAGTLPDLGFYQWWLEALNGSGIASPPAGPLPLFWLRPVTNLIAASDDLTATAWTKSNLTVSANTVAGPDPAEGAIADTVMEAATASVSHVLSYPSVPISAGQPVRFTVAVKANGRTSVICQIGDPANPSANNVSIAVNTATLVTSGHTAAGTATFPAGMAAGFSGTGGVMDLGNGWVLISLRGVIGSLSQVTPRIILRDAAGATVYTGDTTRGVYAVAAGLSQ